MTYTQMKMLIEFIKVVAFIMAKGPCESMTDKAKRLEDSLLMSCGYERKF